MKVYNEEKTTILTEYDLEKGYLKADKLFIAHHEATEEVQEQSHYEVIKEYSNGGKDVKKVIDVAGVKAKDSWDEYENIQVYVPYSKSELNKQRIDKLKGLLAKYDYIGTKIATGRATKEEYTEQIKQMIEWADEINQLEKEV